MAHRNNAWDIRHRNLQFLNSLRMLTDCSAEDLSCQDFGLSVEMLSRTSAGKPSLIAGFMTELGGRTHRSGGVSEAAA